MGRPEPLRVYAAARAGVAVLLASAFLTELLPDVVTGFLLLGAAATDAVVNEYYREKVTPLAAPQNADGVPLVPLVTTTVTQGLTGTGFTGFGATVGASEPSLVVPILGGTGIDTDGPEAEVIITRAQIDTEATRETLRKLNEAPARVRRTGGGMNAPRKPRTPEPGA